MIFKVPSNLSLFVTVWFCFSLLTKPFPSGLDTAWPGHWVKGCPGPPAVSFQSVCSFYYRSLLFFSDFSISSCFHPHLGLQWGFLSFFCGLLKGCLCSEKAQISSRILILLLAGGRALACESQWMLTLPCQPSGKPSIVSFSKDSQAMHFSPLDQILLHPFWSALGPKLAGCPCCWVQKWRHCANTTQCSDGWETLVHLCSLL